MRIYVEKPQGWEYLVFAKILQDHVSSHKKRRLDLELGISYGPVIDLRTYRTAIEWVSDKFTQITQITSTLTNAFNSGLIKAVGEPGEPGDIQRIEHLASRIADGYLQAIEWTLEFHRLNIEPRFEKLMKLASLFSSNMLREIEEFSQELYDKINFKIKNHTSGEEVKFTLTISLPDTDPFMEEMHLVVGNVPE